MRARSSRASRADRLGPAGQRRVRGQRARAPGRASGDAGSSTPSSSRCQRSRWLCRVRSATRSSRWSTSRRSSRSGPSSVATGRSGSREGGPGDGEGVDRVALAGLADRAAGAGHELGRHPDDRLAGAHEIGLQAAGEVAAVLERPAPLRRTGRPSAAARGGPSGVAPHRLLGELATGLAHGHDRVRALVQIRAEDDHVRVSSSHEVTEDRSADTAEWGRSHAPIKSRRPVRRVWRPAERDGWPHPSGWASSLGAKPGDAAEGDTHRRVRHEASRRPRFLTRENGTWSA